MRRRSYGVRGTAERRLQWDLRRARTMAMGRNRLRAANREIPLAAQMRTWEQDELKKWNTNVRGCWNLGDIWTI
jgi:hypothetical protein